jgi:hypothetical protein
MKQFQNSIIALSIVLVVFFSAGCTTTSPTEVVPAICAASNVDCPCTSCAAVISICTPPSPMTLSQVNIGDGSGCHESSDFPYTVVVPCDNWTTTTVIFSVEGSPYITCPNCIVSPNCLELYSVKSVDLTPYSDCSNDFTVCPDWTMPDGCGQCS